MMLPNNSNNSNKDSIKDMLLLTKNNTDYKYFLKTWIISQTTKEELSLWESLNLLT